MSNIESLATPTPINLADLTQKQQALLSMFKALPLAEQDKIIKKLLRKKNSVKG